MTLWRVSDDGKTVSEPLPAADVVEVLLASDGLPWAVPEHGAEQDGMFACDIPEVRASLFDFHLRQLAQWWLRSPGYGPMWAAHLADGACSSDSVRAMQLIREMVAISETNEELAFIGAGMLEDLLRRQGPAAIADIEQAAATDPRFRFALAAVWPNEMFPEVWARVAVALTEQQRY